MAGKRILDLNTVSTYTDSDYIVLSNSATGYNTKIVKSNFINSIGNPSIDGYKCVNSGANQYTLTPASGDAVGVYYDQMVVRFLATADSTGAVQVRIGSLPYKPMLKLGTTATSDFINGQYYEAVYNGGTGEFWQTNLEATSTPSYNAHVASSSAPNQITLTRSDGQPVNSYPDGYVASFNAPITSTGVVQIQLASLGFVNLYKYNSLTAATVTEDEFYSVIYNATENKFYHTNAVEATLYSNEYLAVGTVALDELSTTYQLTSAIGSPKVSYYNGMTGFFTVDISSKGVVFVNIDGLGDKVLGEGDTDPIANNLYAGQPLYISYDGTEFIKHRFAVTNPPAPPIDPEEPIPDGNLVDINVGPTRTIKTVKDAIKALVEEFGSDGGNRLATIHLDADFLWVDKVAIPADHDYSWITVTSTTDIPIDYGSGSLIYTHSRSVSFITTGIYTVTGNNGAVFRCDTDGLLLLKDLSISSTAAGTKLFETTNIGGNINMDNVNTTGFQYIIPNMIGSNISGTNCSFLDFTHSFSEVRDGSIILNNCTIDSSVNTHVAILYNNSKANFVNCTVRSKPTVQLLTGVNHSEGILTNCSFISRSNSQIGVQANSTSTLFIEGGDYRNFDNSVTPTNIFANNYAVITLINNPLGGASATAGGQIITI